MQLNGADRTRLAVIAGGVVLGLAVYEVINSFVRGLLAPLISVFIGNSHFELNSFTIKGTEFSYGFFIEALLAVAVAALIASLVFRGLLPEKFWTRWWNRLRGKR